MADQTQEQDDGEWACPACGVRFMSRAAAEQCAYYDDYDQN